MAPDELEAISLDADEMREYVGDMARQLAELALSFGDTLTARLLVEAADFCRPRNGDGRPKNA